MSNGCWVTILVLVGDRPRDGGGPSMGLRVTVLMIWNDCHGDRNTYGLWYSYRMFISKICDKQTDRQTDTTMYRVLPQLKKLGLGQAQV